MTQKLKVRFKEPRSTGYEILLQPGVLAQADPILARRFPGHQPFVLSSPRIHGLYGKALEASLRRAGFQAGARHLCPDGEQHKDFVQFQAALEALAAFGHGLKAKPLALLLGGGVVGDLGGFAASCYRRGIPFVQVPTTLLSMLDSSVGGKLGVDLRTRSGVIKNLVGAFYQPSLVLVDPLLLRTLPAVELRSGLAEALKTALLFDPALFKKLETRSKSLLGLEPGLLSELLRRCLAHKARVVGADEFDRRGGRVLLNLGHTFGHAAESASGFKLKHGQAVAFGLCCACDLSRRLGLARGSAAKGLGRVEALVMKLGLPSRLSGPSLAKVMAALRQDKKFGTRMRFVLPLRIGRCKVVELKSEAMVREVLAARLM